MAACSSKRTVLNEEDVPGAKFKKIPKDCSVIELKRWLECHGLQKKGNKTELVERVNLSTGVGTPGGLCTPDGIFAQNDSLYL